MAKKSKSGYVDGFVLCIKKNKIKAYKKMAQLGKEIWLKHGALDYCEAVAEDWDAKGCLPFPKMAKAKAGETVVFAWITFKSRAHRDSVNKKVMKDPAMSPSPEMASILDMKRMAYGGFKIVVG